MPIEFLFLGQLTFASESFLSYLSEHDYKVTVINTSDWAFRERIYGTNIPVYNLYEDSKIHAMFKGPLMWYRKALLYGVAKNLGFKRDRLSRIIDKTEKELIYGNWGSYGLPEIGMAQRFHVPIVYEFLTYPCSSIRLGYKIENFFNKRIVNKLDGRVFPTQRMYNYMRNVFGIHLGKNLLFSECFTEKFYYRRRLPLLSAVDGQPHVVFIGIDDRDILPQIEEVASRKIHVHMCNLNQVGWASRLFTSAFANAQEGLIEERAFKNLGFIHQFNRFNHQEIADGTFATFLTQFDACLVTYNFWYTSGLYRFSNSIPQRFSMALLAGIPIIVPEGYLQGCEEIINKYEIGFAYKNYIDLKNKLYDKSLLNRYRENAIKNAHVFSLENNFIKMDKFLKRIIE